MPATRRIIGIAFLSDWPVVVLPAVHQGSICDAMICKLLTGLELLWSRYYHQKNYRGPINGVRSRFVATDEDLTPFGR